MENLTSRTVGFGLERERLKKTEERVVELEGGG